jgi:hypothetical protein
MSTSSREYDPEIKDIADYVANKAIDSELAVSFCVPVAADAPHFPKHKNKKKTPPSPPWPTDRGASRMNSAQFISPELE